ncbi:MAG: hypothetical protein IIX01_00305 [Clostridia bacterium]|nr:hypothetical protein [Clostridia bacterium]
MERKVCKFGGSSLADGKAVLSVTDIVFSDESRRYILPSAPGKRFLGDVKVTDLLYRYYRSERSGDRCANGLWEKISNRFEEISTPFSLSAYVNETLWNLRKSIADYGEAYCVSRGEWLTAKILSKGWEFPFLDAESLPLFYGNVFAENCYPIVKNKAERYQRAIVSAFYGANEKGEIKTFSRGGGDVSGAVLSRALHADLYENWTDVDGVYDCDPNLVENAKRIDVLTGAELSCLAQAGACVLHGEALSVLKGSGVLLWIGNTFAPKRGGTLVEPSEKKRTGLLALAGREYENGGEITLVGNADEGQKSRLINAVKDFFGEERERESEYAFTVLVRKGKYRQAIREIYKQLFG